MLLIILSLICLALALLPACLFLDNLRLYRAPRRDGDSPRPAVSVLIPARNEEASIEAAVCSALGSTDVVVEVVVLDDHSTDRTAALVAALAERDRRVVLSHSPALPDDWCGKQHACAVLATVARHPILVFIDADVRLAPDGLARAVGFLRQSRAALVSGIPSQETATRLERLVIPLIHLILLGFLPMRRMRADGRPGYAAGCGQLFVTDRGAYERAGGHAAIRATFHDGLKLPRAYRAAGLRTDLFDATDVATCRMYQGAGALWRGLTKNATEGLGSPALIGPFTVLLLGGQVAPFALLALTDGPARLAAGLGVLLAYLPRAIGVARFRQPMAGALLHPIGVAVLVAIQWHALTRALIGRPATWKGRPAPAPRDRAERAQAGRDPLPTADVPPHQS